MILSFRHRGLKRFYDDDDTRGINAHHAEKIRRILTALDGAKGAEAMNLPGYRLHPLKGYWSVTVQATGASFLRSAPATRSMWICSTITRGKRIAPMPMKNPAHPGSLVLHDCIEPLGLSITFAAQALGVSRFTLSELVNGKRGISAEMAVRLEKAFGGTAEGWLTQQAHYDLAQIRQDRIKVKRLELV